MSAATLRRSLLAWYRRCGRDLPWRTTEDPYAILVAELMLQQTQVSRVRPRYKAWLGRFPTFERLARASTADVLRHWQGLGYNRRALNLQRCAQAVMASGGALPREDAALRALPGIGPYTAAAVRCFGFGQQVAPLDVNVLRVLHRLHDRTNGPPKVASAAIRALAQQLVRTRDPAAVANALMDLGATTCTARTPRCQACPLERQCISAHHVAPTARRRSGAPFSGSDRQVRGRLLRALVEGPAAGLSLSMVHRRWSSPPRPTRARLGSIATALSREGLLRCRRTPRGLHLQLPLTVDLPSRRRGGAR